MKLADIKAAGGIVSAEPVEKHIVWIRDDETIEFEVLIVRQSFGTIERIFFTETDERSKSAKLIAASVVFEGGEAITYEDAYRLEPSLAGLLINAINEVNGTGRADPKN